MVNLQDFYSAWALTKEESFKAEQAMKQFRKEFEASFHARIDRA